MKKIFFFAVISGCILFFTESVLAQAKFICGEYYLRGVITEHNGEPVLALYQGSMSETLFKLPKEMQNLAAYYMNQSVTVHGRVLTPVNGRRGEVLLSLSEIENKDSDKDPENFMNDFSRGDIVERFPDPLSLDKDNGIDLLQKIPCLKTSHPIKEQP